MQARDPIACGREMAALPAPEGRLLKRGSSTYCKFKPSSTGDSSNNTDPNTEQLPSTRDATDFQGLGFLHVAFLRVCRLFGFRSVRVQCVFRVLGLFGLTVLRACWV